MTRSKLGLIGYGAIGKHVDAALKAGDIENLEAGRRPGEAAAREGAADARARPVLRPQLRRRGRMRRARGRAHATGSACWKAARISW